jgi:hypothetical protein
MWKLKNHINVHLWKAWDNVDVDRAWEMLENTKTSAKEI